MDKKESGVSSSIDRSVREGEPKDGNPHTWNGQGSKASNQPVRDMNLVDSLDVLPRVPSLDTWKAVLREGLD
jgi:hypothetical protein